LRFVAARHTEELRDTAAQCLALSRSTTDPRTRTNLLILPQKLYDMASGRPGVFEKVQQEFNDHQMLPPARLYPQPTVQQQQQIQPKTEE
jgi:hypothetical protein